MADELKVRISLSGASIFYADLEKVADYVRDLGKELASPVLKFASASVAAETLGEFVKQAFELNLQIGEMAERSGLAVHELSGLSYASARAGISFDEFQRAIRPFKEWLTATGQGSKNLHEALLEQAEYFKSLPDGVEKSALAVQRFGREGEALIPVLNKGSEGMEELLTRGEYLNAVTEAGVAASMGLKTVWTDFKAAATGAANSIQPLATLIGTLELKTFTEEIAAANNAFLKFSGLSAPKLPPHVDEPKEMGKVWTEQELEIQNRLLDIKREGYALDRAQGNMSAKGLDANKNSASDMASLDKEQALIEQKRQNAADALSKKAIYQNKFDEIALATRKELLALDLERQAVAKTDVDTDNQKYGLQLDRIQAERALLESDFSKTSADKWRENLEFFQQEEQVLSAKLRLLTYQKEKSNSPGAYGAVIFDASKQLTALEDKFAQFLRTANPNSFADQWISSFTRLANEWGTMAQKMGQLLTTSVNGAIGTVSQNLTSVIMKTTTWDQALRNIGMTIETEILQEIIKIGIQSLLQAAEAALAWVPAATLSLIATDGASGTAAVGVLGSMTFADGGYTGGGGKYDVAGVVHRGEFVMPQEAVGRIGLSRLESMRRGEAGATPMLSAGGGDTHIHVHGLESSVSETIARHPDARHEITKLVKGQLHTILPRRV
jgi:lambda family phage tail tape measure protein